MGYFSRQEFTLGLKLLNALSLDKLRKALPKLDKDIDEDEDTFSSFFAFAFKFCLMVSACLPWARLLPVHGDSWHSSLAVGAVCSAKGCMF